MVRMNAMHIDKLDLNLLLLFDRLWAERSVTRAADRMGLTQSAVSHGLARLRTLFNDRLFVRAGGQMLPTPRAAELASTVQEVMQRLERELFPRTHFEPASAQRSFSVALSDLGETVMLPALLQAFAQQAPGCQLRSVRLPIDSIEDALASGAVDLAVGNVFEPRRNGFQQTLYAHDYRVIAWDSHPRLGARLSLAQYQAERHLVADVGSDEHLRQQGLQAQGVQRKVAARVGGLLSLPWLLPETELIATVPSHLAHSASGRFPLQHWPLPLVVPGYAIKSAWHARMQGDSGHRWFRDLVYQQMRHYPDWQWEQGHGQPALRPRAAARRGAAALSPSTARPATRPAR